MFHRSPPTSPAERAVIFRFRFSQGLNISSSRGGRQCRGFSGGTTSRTFHGASRLAVAVHFGRFPLSQFLFRVSFAGQYRVMMSAAMVFFRRSERMALSNGRSLRSCSSVKTGIASPTPASCGIYRERSSIRQRPARPSPPLWSSAGTGKTTGPRFGTVWSSTGKTAAGAAKYARIRASTSDGPSCRTWH